MCALIILYSAVLTSLCTGSLPPMVITTPILSGPVCLYGADHQKTLITREIKTMLTSYQSWQTVVNLDMTNESHICPNPWISVTSPHRLCTAPTGCHSVYFTPSTPTTFYSHVLGRVRGYGQNSVDGFYRYADPSSMNNIDRSYLDGVSITHGFPRKHIWSLAAGHDITIGRLHCDCDFTINTTEFPLVPPPPFVGDSYYCDRAYNGFLWDGLDCVTDCCTFHSPPWFNVTLPYLTTDSIEVRICTDEAESNEKIYIQQLEILIK